MTITRMAGPSLSNTRSLIMQHIKKREVSMNHKALAYCPPQIGLSYKERLKVSNKNQEVVKAIKECEESVKKLQLISDFLKVADTRIINKLMRDNRFDLMSRTEILKELIAASD